MNNGWIKLHRSLAENPVFDNVNVRAVWIECLLAATHTDHRVMVGKNVHTLTAGQFVFGRNAWSKKLGIKPSTLRNVITRLVQVGAISGHVQGQGTATIYQIENWNKYQTEDRSVDTSRTGLGQVEDINKNDKKEKNGRNKKVKAISLFEEEAKKVNEQFNLSFGTNYRSTDFTPNLEHWRKTYSMQEILEAIVNASRDAYWKDKMKPSVLLRQRNGRGEPVDYIGDMLNSTRKQIKHKAGFQSVLEKYA